MGMVHDVVLLGSMAMLLVVVWVLVWCCWVIAQVRFGAWGRVGGSVGEQTSTTLSMSFPIPH